MKAIDKHRLVFSRALFLGLRRLLLFGLFGFSGFVLWGQTLKQDFNRARELFMKVYQEESAIEFKGLPQFHFQMKGLISNPRQSYNLLDTLANDREERSFGYWYYDFENRLFRSYTREQYHGGHDLRFEELNRNDTSFYINTQMRNYTSAPSDFSNSMSWFLYVPGLFMEHVKANLLTLSTNAPVEIDGISYQVLEIDFLDIRRRLFIDPDTYLIKRISWLTPDLILGLRENSVVFGKRAKVGGQTIAKTITRFLENKITEKRSIVNSGSKIQNSDHVFDLEEDLIQLTKEPWSIAQISDNVYQMQGLGYNLYTIPFVVFEEEILIYDAILAPGVLERAVAIIEKKWYGKPVKYVVLSHNHTDHIQGLKAMKDKGVTIITSPETLPRIEELMTAPTSEFSLPLDTKSKARGNYQIEIVQEGEPLKIGDGKAEIMIYNLGSTPHVSGLLYAHVESDDLIIQADGYFGFSPWGEAFDFMVDWVKTLELENPVITGVHHEPMPLSRILEKKTAQAKGIEPGYLKTKTR